MFWPTGPEEIKTKIWNHAFASAGSDLEAVGLQQVMTMTASVHPKSGWIINAGANFLCLIQFYLYSTILCSWAGSLYSCCMWFWMSGCFLLLFLNIYQSGILTVLFGFCMTGAIWNCCYVLLQFICVLSQFLLLTFIDTSAVQHWW